MIDQRDVNISKMSAAAYNVFITGGRWEHRYHSKQRNLRQLDQLRPPHNHQTTNSYTVLRQKCTTKYLCSLYFEGKKPMVKSVDMTLINNSNKVKLVCRIKDFSRETEIYWKKDGQPLIEIQGKIKIRSKR